MSCLLVVVGCSSSDSASAPATSYPDANAPEDGSLTDEGLKPDSGTDAWAQDAAAETESSTPQDASTEGDAAVELDAVAVEADAKPPATLQETEPNNGKVDGEFNALPVGSIMVGALDTPGDTDIFRFDATAGKVYTISLEMPVGSKLQGHLTVMDDGRDGHTEGDDFVKIVRGDSGTLTLDMLAMGLGGYYVVVRDTRNVAGQSVGTAGFDYKTTVVERDPATFEAAAMTFPVSLSETLASAGTVRLYPFDGTTGANVLFDLKAKGDMDGRLLVFAKATGSWIARNDDRAMGDSNPLIDAPLFESGAMWLVVENVREAPANLGYTLNGTMP
jgi:hypothetical protein